MDLIDVALVLGQLVLPLDVQLSLRLNFLVVDLEFGRFFHVKQLLFLANERPLRMVALKDKLQRAVSLSNAFFSSLLFFLCLGAILLQLEEVETAEFLLFNVNALFLFLSVSL